MHGDAAGQRCAEEIEVAHDRSGVSRRVRDGNTHRAVNLRSKLIAVVLERRWQPGDVRRLVVGYSEQGVLQATTGRPPVTNTTRHGWIVDVQRPSLCYRPQIKEPST